MLEVRTLQWGERKYRAGYWTNLFVRPEFRAMNIYPRRALTMFREAAHEGIEVVYAAARRPGVAKAHLALGMRRIGDLPVLAKPLRPVRLFAKLKGLGWASGRLSAWPDAIYGTATRLWRPRAEPYPRAEEVSWNSADLAQLFQLSGRLRQGRVHQVRTLPSFRQRFATNLDDQPYILLAIRKAGRFLAGVLYRMAERDRRIRLAVIMDIFYESDGADALRRCLLEVERRTYEAGAEAILCLPGWHDTVLQILRDQGYLTSPETYTLLWRVLDKSSHSGPVPDDRTFHFALSDHDAF
jgi:hypothetical protein